MAGFTSRLFRANSGRHFANPWRHLVLTIVTPDGNQNLVTLETVKAALGIAGSADDASLTFLIGQASSMIATHCGRVFIKEVVNETFRPTSPGFKAALMLSRYPVFAIASVTERGLTLAASGYAFDQASGVLERIYGDRAGCWSGACVVAYTGGYGPDGIPVPADLQGAAIALVDHLRRRAGSNPMVRSSEIAGIGSNTYEVPSTAIPEFITCSIEPYRALPIG
ncbi:head-tail connector protein [Tardiphaga sp. vice278]|uniref:head-tail connector protein n=1 Tax=Tardiphaga sp. vice278 TaxID=2592815 RepID=UPI001161FE52|nr:head-tail connector protein [Tardiphaga sp. vice278]QDM14588.1 phage gp6-like head-tail connector protein [Tardiphaga sp. vice278]